MVSAATTGSLRRAWTELAELRDLAGPAAARLYPGYVRLLHAIAEAGSYRAEQLEFFLAELGDAF